MKRAVIVIILTLLLLVGGIFLFRWIVHTMDYVYTDDAQVRSNLVAVNSKVAARILYLAVDEGDSVKKGDVLVRLDDRDLKAQLLQYQAQLEAARTEEKRQADVLVLQEKEASQRIEQSQELLATSQKQLNISHNEKILNAETMKAAVLKQEASLEQAKAEKNRAQASAKQAGLDAVRAKNLYQDGAMPLQLKEQADTQKSIARDNLVAAEKKVLQEENLLLVARANLRTITVKELQYMAARNTVASNNIGVDIAELEKSRTEAEREVLKTLAAKRREMEAKVRYQKILVEETVIYSPVSGTVARRNVNLSEMAAPGSALYYLTDLKDIWVTANIEEQNIHRFDKGASVDIHVDAFPDRKFRGSVQFIGPVTSSELSLFPSDNPSGNFIKVAHRLPVRIKVTQDSEHLLKPGMNVEVDIEARKNRSDA